MRFPINKQRSVILEYGDDPKGSKESLVNVTQVLWDNPLGASLEDGRISTSSKYGYSGYHQGSIAEMGLGE
jgi:hypothetical protein